MNKEIFDTMARLSAEELIDILVREDEYQEIAINYAKEELARRRLDKSEIDTMFQVRQELNNERIRKATESLTAGWKLLYLLFPIVIPIYAALPFIMKFILPHPPGFLCWRDLGYFRKSAEAGWYTLVLFFG
jgi:hypothetical protein